MSLPSLPDRPRHQQQGAQDALDPQHPRAHWETVGGETHAGEYSQNFNSSNSSDPTSLSGEGIKMTPLRGRGRGRGGTTRGGGASGGQGSSSQQQERQQQHQAPEQASPPAGSQAQDQDPYIQQQPMVYVQPGAEPPTEPDPALVRDRGQPSPPGKSSDGLPGHDSGHRRRRSQSRESRSRSRSRHAADRSDNCCC